LKKDLVFDKKYFEELRLNLDSINFTKLSKYVKKFKSKKIKKVFNVLKDIK